MKNRNLYFFITIVITSYLQFACSSSAVGEPPSGIRSKLPVSETLQWADELFAGRTDIEKLRQAVELTAQLRDPSDRQYEVEWKFAKYSYFLGKSIEDEVEAQAIFEKGKQAGKIASRMQPDKPDGHFWHGANLGELAGLSPVTVGIKSIDEIRESMNAVIRIEPAYQMASAYDALAQVEMKTRLYGGNAEKAVEYLEAGLKLDATNPNIRANLAEAYLAVKRDADAKRQIDEFLKMAPHPEYPTEHAAAVQKVKRLLETSF